MRPLLNQIEYRNPQTLKANPRNARVHSAEQVGQLKRSIVQFGFVTPVLIDDDGLIIAGHGRIMAACELGMQSVPVIRLSNMSETDKRAYMIADNKLALNAGWDKELLAIELQELIELDFDVSLTGFTMPEIDITLDQAASASTGGLGQDTADRLPSVGEVAITRVGDIWKLGRHQLLCGDARSGDEVARLMDGENAAIVFTDPPYNVPIDGHVCGTGKVRHREFAFASGEMTSDQFTAFLAQTLGNCARHCQPGAIAYVCMDWRHIDELTAAGKQVFSELKNLCVWNKTNGGMGSFYRSKHELVFVYKVSDGAHINNFALGQHGRYRTNVWDYAGVNTVGSERDELLALHPTVKPVAMIADALKDCSNRSDIVLDLFGGSGSSLIAAEACGRRARLMELDPLYCDVIVRRWQEYSGKFAGHADTGNRFDDYALNNQESSPQPAKEEQSSRAAPLYSYL